MAAGEQEAVEAVFRLANLSLQMLTPVLKATVGTAVHATTAVIKKTTVTQKGRLGQLVEKGSLEHIDISKTDLGDFKKALKSLKVDFSLAKEPGTDIYHAFFNAESLDRVNIAVNRVLGGIDGPEKGPGNLDEKIALAKEQAKARTEQAQEKNKHRERPLPDKEI
ncbi:DUF3801 domain-containing protein [Lacticaseibacillus suibinensis]|uniref:DUF3801 domain-containing protein n=1 Tax=Lacticaseibacillus suibinensis TaxID=2486011 RepID=UPI000F77E127|nr:DUF3801 domain-containing protein [Lacticaseibacillus suibinensis]